jgi:hypothetical protein
MRRATGFLVGALLMLALFLLAVGAGNPPTLVKEVVVNKTELAAVPAVPAGPGGPTRADVPTPTEVPAAESAALPFASSTALDEDSRLAIKGSGPDVTGGGLALDPQSWNQSIASQEAAYRRDATQVSRYQVWSPFRSEWAARGFARRLALATDVPMEVVNEAAGNYQVVFSYRDDGERQTLVRHIETVTGLELE